MLSDGANLAVYRTSCRALTVYKYWCYDIDNS
jgi:hypothetical protein